MDLREIALHKSQKRHPWELARIKVIINFLRNLIKDSQKSITILDVGSGDTYLIRELSKEFTNASFYAVDINYDAEYINTTNGKFGEQGIRIKVFNNMASLEQTLGGPADLVLLLDVVEHVPDDIQFLKELSASKAITVDTAFLITVPAYQKLFCAHDVFLGHYRRYNNQLLRQNISRAGLQVVAMGYFFSLLLLPRFLQVLLDKKNKGTGHVTGIGNWEGSESVSKMLVGILWLDFSISSSLQKLGIKLPGLSNFAICKKSA